MEADSIRWKQNSDGILSVSRHYSRRVQELPGRVFGPWGKIWKNKVPVKVRYIFLAGDQKGLLNS